MPRSQLFPLFSFPCRQVLPAACLMMALFCTAARLPAETPQPDRSSSVPLEGTQPLQLEEPLDEFMVRGIDEYALRKLHQARAGQEQYWKRDTSSVEAYLKSIEPNRKRFREITGAVDQRTPGRGIELLATTTRDSLVGQGDSYSIHTVRWQVLEGVTAEGLLLQPAGEAVARVVAIPDADWTPEQFCGLAPGVPAVSQLPRRLAQAGCQVLVPTVISRSDEFSGNPLVRYTNQTHREFIYRMAFEMGRHVIGYEVERVLAAVDLFEALHAERETPLPTGVAGTGEGGLLAMYSAACDTRIDAVLVSGYFQSREGIWEEPIYRNVWSLMKEFGDAGVASLVAPRPLFIEACAVPEVAGPPQVRKGRSGGAAPGAVRTATIGLVRSEFDRVSPIYTALKVPEQLKLEAAGEGDGPSGSTDALTMFATALGADSGKLDGATAPTAVGEPVNAQLRQQRQFDELVVFTQTLLRRSSHVRDNLWKAADRSSIEAWQKSAAEYADMVWDTMIGRITDEMLPANARTRKILDEPEYTGYEVLLDVYPDVVAGGILLLPKDLKPGEKRPVVVCQHGLEGVPMDTIISEGRGFQYYSAFAANLCKRGFITYAPQNPYRGKDRFRTLQRKSNPLGLSLFSYILPQHRQTLRWLGTLPFVDAQRIGFYGLSYGGKTAVRVPPLLPEYALSICSADYDEWILKIVTNEARYSYLFTGE
ncbi:MAG: hypothetical protein KDA79_14245, partial [Planctomycetaceae bacterium]|nr:hypothetical protein [Planctomycetaceae bacterium]